jgi:hypothetical protein
LGLGIRKQLYLSSSHSFEEGQEIISLAFKLAFGMAGPQQLIN